MSSSGLAESARKGPDARISYHFDIYSLVVNIQILFTEVAFGDTIKSATPGGSARTLVARLRALGSYRPNGFFGQKLSGSVECFHLCRDFLGGLPSMPDFIQLDNALKSDVN